jgi:hypothetical protein
MAVKILPAQIRNLQQIEAVVAGPDDVNRLFIIDGQFDCQMSLFPPGAAGESQKETFTVLAGPVFTRKQFAQANGTASFTKTGFNASTAAWQILGVDADWDDESGQVEVRIEAEVDCSGATKSAFINGFAFHVTILAAVAGA